MNSKLRGVPQRRTSTLALSSGPTGTLASGRLGSDISIVASSAWIASSRAAERSSSPAMPFTSAISALASAPCPFFLPISFDRLLRRACSSSVRICRPLRSDSSVPKRATSRNGCGDWRVSSRATTVARSLRRSVISSMAAAPQVAASEGEGSGL